MKIPKWIVFQPQNEREAVKGFTLWMSVIGILTVAFAAVIVLPL